MGRMHRISALEEQEAKKQVDELISKKFTRTSPSPYGALALFVVERNGTLRMCVNYRALNRQNFKDKYPLPSGQNPRLNLEAQFQVRGPIRLQLCAVAYAQPVCRARKRARCAHDWLDYYSL